MCSRGISGVSMIVGVARKGLGRARTQHYSIARAEGLARRRWAERSAIGTPIVIHQMGKVASSSIRTGIRNAQPRRRVFQVHHLTDRSIAAEERTYRAAWKERPRINTHLLDSIHLQGLLKRDRLPTGALVLSLTRDPMAQRVSSFFQSMQFRDPAIFRRIGTEPLDRLVERAIEGFWEPGWWHEPRLQRFFNDEFTEAWGVDVFATPFDRQHGWTEYPHPRFRVLVMRFEDIDVDVLNGLVGGERFELPHRLDVSKRSYGELRRLFAERLGASRGYLDEAFGNPSVTHFYDAAEITEFRRGWEPGTREPRRH